MNDTKGHTPTCGGVEVGPVEDRVKALCELVNTLRQADQALAQAADIPPDDLVRVAPELVQAWMGDATTADPAVWAERAATDAQVAAGRLEAALRAFAGRLLQAALGDTHIVPAAHPTAAIAFRPAWAPTATWYGLRRDRLPLDLRQLVPPEACPTVDGIPVFVLGTKLLPAHLAADVVRYTAQARQFHDERERRVREEQERLRNEEEFRRREARRLRELD